MTNNAHANGHVPAAPAHNPGCSSKSIRLGTGVFSALEAVLRWLTAYPLFLLQLVVLLLVAWGGLGEELGAEHLFWHEHCLIQLGTGITVGLLVTVLLFLNYLLYRPTWLVGSYPADPDRPGILRRVPGTLLPSVDPEVRLCGRYLLWGLLTTLLLIIGPKFYAAAKASDAERVRAAAVATGLPPTAAIPDGARGYLYDRRWLVPFVVGYAFAAVFVFGMFLVDERRRGPGRPTWRDWLVNLRVVPPIGRVPWAPWRSVRKYLLAHEPDPVPKQVVALHGIGAMLMVLAPTVLAGLMASAWVLDRWRPGFSLTGLVSLVSLIFIVLSLLYGFFEFHFHIQRLILVGVVGLLLVWNSTDFFNGANNYKLQFPGLEADSGLGEGDVNLPLWDPNQQDNGTDVEAVLRATAPYAKAHLIPSEEPLQKMCERWQARPGHEREKPRVVIVCTSGGGIRAAVWTGVVLHALERDQRMPEFRNHIRLITGASGGMVGATLYAADFENGPRDYAPALGEDSLTRTGQSLVLRDMVWNTAFVPPWHHADWDRGRTLEWMWELNAAKFLTPQDAEHRQGWKNPFTKTFAELRGLEREGKRPSLIYSPLMVEDSRRLLLSNLDLSGLPNHSPLADLSTATGPHDMAGRSAIEFHRLFPDLPLDELRKLLPPLDQPNPDPVQERARLAARRIRSSKDFRIVTAARMNATFPVVSPAVSLPTFPPRRLVDAGIYDNYGVNLAALWLLKHQAAVRKYTSGVALVQVRAFPLHDARNRFASFDPNTGTLAAKPPRGDLLADSLAAASAPAEALLAARANAAFFRNAEQIEQLHRAFNFNNGVAAPSNDLFFCVAWLELRRPAALNWYLTKTEFDAIRAAYADSEVAEEHQKLRTWFGTGGKVAP
jgi:hypothetical protein